MATLKFFTNHFGHTIAINPNAVASVAPAHCKAEPEKFTDIELTTGRHEIVKMPVPVVVSTLTEE